MAEARLPRDPPIDRHFEPAVMAQDLAKSVEALSAASDAVPSNQLDREPVDRLVASVNASRRRASRAPVAHT